MQATQNSRLFWQLTTGSRTVEFGRIPFSVGEKRILDCQYGLKYYKSRELTGKRWLYLQGIGSRKQGCTAHIELTEYVTYPLFQIPAESMSKKKERKVKEELLLELKEGYSKWRNYVPQSVSKYFVSLPSRRNVIQLAQESGTWSSKIHPLDNSEDPCSCLGGYVWLCLCDSSECLVNVLDSRARLSRLSGNSLAHK